ncbi:MAG TPA: sigma-70 family RNA polymerase sigma factor [Candidatus Acidoferrales bacterium]|nr:sigma-70 family RNA polymerase sigma factor [Candidatus Acidoferrales bacterium]
MAERVLRGTGGSTSRADADERLLVEAAQRDPARFGELYERHFDQVYAFIARRVRDRTETEDLTSEVFRRALANLNKFEWRGTPLAAWLMRIAANAVADRWKRRAREMEMTEGGGAQEPSTREARHDGERAQLFRLVDRLPAEQRRVILLRFAEEKSVRQIAGGIGRSEGAVRQLQFRALEKLRAQLDAAPARKSDKKDG